jgi:Transposase DDE domain/Transposase domain (DUF772)
MFRKNDQHRQGYVFSSISDLPQKQRERLEGSWAGTFYAEFFSRIDEAVFAELYSDKDSRPNVPVNVLVGLEVLKAGFGWSDAELEEQMTYSLLTRYALGYRDLSEGHFELRTVYNFRRRLAQHMQETGVNLLEVAFERITDKQIKVLKLKTGKLRMDSVQIGSNIRQLSRLQLLVEVLQRVWRMLSVADQQREVEHFAPYIQGSSGQFVYHLQPGEGGEQLRAMGEVMQRLLRELAPAYRQEAPYAVLARVYYEHFVEVEQVALPKAGEALSAQSLQSPDDLEATYRSKRGVGYQGYVTNVTETCDPHNDLQLIVKVQSAPNHTDDAAMLKEAIPDLVSRTDVEEIYSDGGFNSPAVDKVLNQAGIEQFQTAIRGTTAESERLRVSDFVFTRDEAGLPQTVKCPQGQEVPAQDARTQGRFMASFDPSLCNGCPFFAQCPAHARRRAGERVLYFDQQAVNVAHRRDNQRQATASKRNLRSAVEATVRSLKHPFKSAKLPVRGLVRVSMLMVGSAAMTNVRRIWRYQIAKTVGETTSETTGNPSSQTASNLFCVVLRPLFRWVTTPRPYQAVAA